VRARVRSVRDLYPAVALRSLGETRDYYSSRSRSSGRPTVPSRRIEPDGRALIWRRSALFRSKGEAQEPPTCVSEEAAHSELILSPRPRMLRPPVEPSLYPSSSCPRHVERVRAALSRLERAKSV